MAGSFLHEYLLFINSIIFIFGKIAQVKKYLLSYFVHYGINNSNYFNVM